MEYDGMCCTTQIDLPGEVAKAMKSDCGTRRDWQRCWSSSRRLRPQRARGLRGPVSCPKLVPCDRTVVTVVTVVKKC